MSLFHQLFKKIKGPCARVYSCRPALLPSSNGSRAPFSVFEHQFTKDEELKKGKAYEQNMKKK